MIVAAWILALSATAQTDADALSLIKGLQDQARAASSIRLQVDLSYSERGPQHKVGPAVLGAQGTDRWFTDQQSNGPDGLPSRFRAAGNGRRVTCRGFREGGRDIEVPEPFTQVVRDECALSSIVSFMSVAFDKLNLKDNRPTIDQATFRGKEKLNGTETWVIEYLLNYPTRTKILIRAWIDPVRKVPVQRLVPSNAPEGGGFLETITAYEIDPKLPDDVFTVPEPTEAEQADERLKVNCRDQLALLHLALDRFHEDLGRYPNAIEGLAALLHQPAGANAWKGPYHDGLDVPKDPWGNDFVYRPRGEAFDLLTPPFPDKHDLPLTRLRPLLVDDIRTRAIAAHLVSIVKVEQDFRAQDRDGNGKEDFWVGDLWGLYRLERGGKELQLLSRTLAYADAAPLKSWSRDGGWPAVPVPVDGYLFALVPSYEDDGKIVPYAQGESRHPDSFAVVAFPVDYPKSGRWTLVVGTEPNRVLRRDLGGKRLTTWPNNEPGPLKWQAVRD